MMRIWRTGAGLWLLVGSLAMGCGDDGDGDGPASITAEEVRAFYGLVPGTCRVYTFGNQQSQTAFVTIEERPSNFPGRNEAIWVLTSPNYPDIERFLEPQDGGAVVMLRELEGVVGQRTTRTYAGEGGKEPLFAQLRRGGGDTLDFASSTFRTQDAKPSETVLPDGSRDEDPPLEDHQWTVIAEGVDVGLPPPFDSTIELSYEVEREQARATSRWNFAPDVGFVRIEDFRQDFGGTGEVYLLDPNQDCP